MHRNGDLKGENNMPQNKGPFYMTTAIAYTSGKPHIGNTYEIVLADSIARFRRQEGYDVRFQTGTDEHGQKIELKAEEAGVTPKEFVDGVSGEIKRIWDLMNTSYDKFIRTTDADHEKQVQKIFKKLYDKGDIYKGHYEGMYCTPCESFFTASQLVDGKCPDCGRPVQPAKEEAYFFKMSKYADRLIKHIEEHPEFIQPESRKNEMMNNFLKAGLQDLCVSRTSFKWGIPVDFDDKHVIYVWIDALSNYITGLGYDVDGNNDALFEKYWPADLHLIGKDILRFHTIYWPIMLMALDLPLPKQVFGHPWLLQGDGKMSKSKGNVIYADDLVDLFGVDAVRYFVLHEMPFENDGVITWELLVERLNSELANTLGNLVNRTIAMSNKYFGGLSSRIGGIRLDEVARDAIAFHKEGMEVLKKKGEAELLPNRGLYAFRKDGEKHAWNPETISTLQLATRLGSYKKFKEFTAMVDSKESPIFLRDFLDFRRAPISIDRVEPVENIVQRFVTGAMSYGSISREAHEAMAIAMNKLHGRSNTGEGGEDRARFMPREDGTSLRSAIKQVASGRFGVTAEYLVNADEIQIKIAQGAKPGEGGQLPGFKVDEVIAKTRHSIPGISLISPPPHHDIYSIEDLAQLIFDLKNVNPRAKISVKLVAESGVGTIAAGVAKAKADLIVISGAEGGTGASPASSIRYAGISPELGLSETQQTLVLNGLRGQVMLQVDGQLKTGRDIILMAMLGAEEFGFATSALIVLGCVMMRKCHQNTCPVGVATQNEKLRKRFRGRSEYLVNFFTFLAQEVREYLAEIGVERLDDIIGRTDLIVRKPDDGIKKHQLISFDKLLARVDNEAAIRHVTDQQHGIDHVKDVEMLHAAAEAVENQKEISLEYTIANTDRACGAMLSGVIAAKYGEKGLPEHTLNVKFKGSAGQSFGAFLVPGVNFKLEGEANDYLGKGLSGGRIAVLPPVRSNFEAEKNTIAGNTLLYGATSGEVYINGRAGERFAVRNSGATAVVEGVGDHCCEYMTGGRVVVLGQTGRNFAAGMSGGVAYVWNRDGNFDYFCNMEMVELSLIEEASYRKELHELIRQHYLYTGSKLARTMLDDWPRYADQFIQVVPIEYKKVLQEEQMQKLQQKIAEMQRDY